MTLYLLRHWRGELSLPVSYLVNGFLLSVVVTITLSLIANGLLAEMHSALLLSVVIIVIWVFFFAIALWQFVGIWRSAVNHMARGGKRDWAIITRYMVIVGTIFAVGAFVGQGVPQLRETFEYAASESDLSAHEQRMQNGGRNIEFTGGFTFGVAPKLSHFLEAFLGLRRSQ